MLYVDTFIVPLWNIGNALIPITAEYVGYIHYSLGNPGVISLSNDAFCHFDFETKKVNDIEFETNS